MPQPKIQQTNNKKLRITNKQTKNTSKFDVEVQSEILNASTQDLSNKQINKNKQKNTSKFDVEV